MLLIPFWLLRLGRALAQISDWVDDNFFPLPITTQEKKQRELQDVEVCARIIRNQIKKCNTLADTYDTIDAVRDFKVIWGNTVQVNACADSLQLAIYNKQQSIINNL